VNESTETAIFQSVVMLVLHELLLLMRRFRNCPHRFNFNV